MRITTQKGWNEAIIDDCSFDTFYGIAEILQNDLNLTFAEKLNNFDTAYWDFDYNGSKLVLHFHIQVGVVIYPLALKDATNEDNANIIEIGTLLSERITSANG